MVCINKPAPASIDRGLLAQIRGCEDTTIFLGTLCTNRCEHRKTCRFKRAPFLIYTRSIKANIKKSKSYQEDGIYVTKYEQLGSQPDAYINEISGAVD